MLKRMQTYQLLWARGNSAQEPYGRDPELGWQLHQEDEQRAHLRPAQGRQEVGL